MHVPLVYPNRDDRLMSSGRPENESENHKPLRDNAFVSDAVDKTAAGDSSHAAWADMSQFSKSQNDRCTQLAKHYIDDGNLPDLKADVACVSVGWLDLNGDKVDAHSVERMIDSASQSWFEL
jgi:hypothetical protein